MRQIEIVKAWLLVVSSAAPVFDPTVNPENVIAPALPLLASSTMQEPSLAGAASVKAPPLMTYCNGAVPQSIVRVPLDLVPRLPNVTLAPPERV